MRIVARYTKEERVKYISHLDLMRAMQRALRRADIPVAFSQGFNPHPKLAFASALSVGVTSEGEYMDVVLKDELSPEEFCIRMNRILPKGISILKGAVLSDRAPSLMSVIERADYLIKLPGTDSKEYVKKQIVRFLDQPEIIVEKKDKKGTRKLDIKDMIYSIEPVYQDHEGIALKVLISSGSRKNLKPEMLAEAFLRFTGCSRYSRELMKIHRLNMYLRQKNNWVTPLEME